MTTLASDFKRIAMALLATVIVVGLAAILIKASDVILLIFLGLLFGVFLAHSSDWIARWLPLGYGWRLGLVTLLVLGLAVGGGVLSASKIEQRLGDLSGRLDKSADMLDAWLQGHPVAKSAVQSIPFVGRSLINELPSRGLPPSATPGTKRPSGNGGDSSDQQEAEAATDARKAVTSVAKSVAGRSVSALQTMLVTTLGLVVNIWLIFFIGLFVAVDPQTYRDGAARLFPLDRRERATEVMNAMGTEMFNWLIGRFITMAITGVGTGLALWVLGVPLPFTIGIITGLLTFIPNIGAYASGALAVMAAMTEGATTVVLVIIAYLGVQVVESYLITPLVQQRLTSIPPAMLLGFQVIMGALAGVLGLLVATPLLAAGQVLVKQLWIRDALGDESIGKHR